MTFQLDDLYEIKPIKSRITGIRRLRDGEQILFQIKGSRSLVEFFGPGGSGNDWSFWIQSEDGKVELQVASAADYLTEDSITFNVPPAGRRILRNISSGDRFIVRVTAPNRAKKGQA